MKTGERKRKCKRGKRKKKEVETVKLDWWRIKRIDFKTRT